MSLPTYAKELSPGKIEVDASQFYPHWLDLLEVKKLDQYWLEVAFICMKLDIQVAVAGTKMAPKSGGALCIFVVDPDKSSGKWALKNYPKGKGTKAAVQGREGRNHFKRIRRTFPVSD